MSKQTSKTIRMHLGWSAIFVGLLFVVINAMPRALGQRHISHSNVAAQAPRISNVNGAAPAAAKMGNLLAPQLPRGSAMAPEGACPSTITQSLNQEIVSGNSVACNNGTATAQNSYWRAFDMSTFTGGREYDVTSVSFGIELANSGSGTGQPLTVNLYVESGAPFPAGTRTLLATTGPFTVPDQALTVLEVPLVATVPAGILELVMEVNSPDGRPDGNVFFIGSNPDGQTGPSYLSSADCGPPDPTNLADLGFPNMQIVFNVNGSCPQATPTPTPSGITLHAHGRRVQGRHTVDLTWSPVTSANIDIYRDGVVIATVPNTGAYKDFIGVRVGNARYIYKVCDAGTQDCSNQVTVRFGAPPL